MISVIKWLFVIPFSHCHVFLCCCTIIKIPGANPTWSYMYSCKNLQIDINLYIYLTTFLQNNINVDDIIRLFQASDRNANFDLLLKFIRMHNLYYHIFPILTPIKRRHLKSLTHGIAPWTCPHISYSVQHITPTDTLRPQLIWHIWRWHFSNTFLWINRIVFSL